jgi:hypothetical protein
MFVESHPGKEDWHPLTAKAVGLGYLIDGARCLHFDLENTTEASRVSLTFRVMMYRDTNGDGNAGGADADDAAGLCPAAMLNDAFTTCERYYDEVVLDLQQRTTDSVVKKNGSRLQDPSPFVGYPFA